MTTDIGCQVDCVVTDPPYKLTRGGKNTGEMGGHFSPDRYNNNGSIVDCPVTWDDIMSVAYRSLKMDSHAYIMCNDKNLRAMLNAAENVGFKFHNLLIWDKHIATPNRWYMKNCEFTGFFRKGKARKINDCGSKTLFDCFNNDKVGHPTEKPVALMEHYIANSTQKGDVVFDPFMGCGTTGAAATSIGRDFIGVELDNKYFTMANDRLVNRDDKI